MGKNTLINIIIVVIAILILLFTYTKIVGPIPLAINSINTNKTDIFQVSGTSKASAIPDKAKINLGITETASSIEKAQNETNTKTDALIKALVTTGAKREDIKTINYSINPDYNPDGTSKINSYTVSQNFEVVVNISNINNAIDSSIASGANLVGGIEFILNDSKREELENKARKEAVKKAKKKAENLANASGIKLGKIVDVKELSPNEPIPVFLEAGAIQTEKSKTTTNITPGENNVEITIILSYQTN